jgi:hypothetical protein
MLRIHFPSRIPNNTLRVLLHAPFSFVDAITWVTLESQVFKTVTLDTLSNSETTSYSFKHKKLIKKKILFSDKISK